MNRILFVALVTAFSVPAFAQPKYYKGKDGKILTQKAYDDVNAKMLGMALKNHKERLWRK